MPKEAARIFLRVTDVKAGRLRPMGFEELEQEGIDTSFGLIGATANFAIRWDNIIKTKDRSIYGWDVNPYVWTIVFERCEKPEGL